MDDVEAQRSSYSPEYGDCTYAVFDIAPRTGFERNSEAEAVISYGSFDQSNDQFSIGGHTQRFAYYASVNGNRTGLGLQTPGPAILHDQALGFGWVQHTGV